MTKFFLAILLILSIYIYATITPSSRADVAHTVALIPQHIGQAWDLATNKVAEVQTDYHAEPQN